MSKTDTQKPAQVRAGTKTKVFTLTVLNADGTELVSKPWAKLTKDATVKLDGQAILLDLSAKANVAASIRLGETPTAHPEILFQGELPWTQKKGGILICADDLKTGCTTVFARWTSDMHQATLCDVCRIKARRLRQKQKRQAAKAAKPAK